MQMQVINLDRSKKRLASFMMANRHLTNVVRYPAIDGQSVDIPLLIKRGLIAEGLVSQEYYTPGALGAAMSHIALWGSATKSEAPVTIAEDDCICHSRFESYTADVIKRLPPDWDMILWGWNFDLFLCFEMLPGVSWALSQFDQDSLRANMEQFQGQEIAPQPFRLSWVFGAPCYSVTAKGARALLGKCLPLRPTVASFPPAARVPPLTKQFRNVGIDSAMNNAYAEIRAYVCFPPIVVTTNQRPND
jgi:GR25 family glycosyltransferase involved in LPS biosynthesis